jgi:hypothetical protein
MKKILMAAVCLATLYSCKKEKSVDTSAGNGTPPVFLGNNCRISQVLTVDSATSIGFEALNLFFNASGAVSRVQLIDSLNNDVFVNDNVTYKDDTIFLGLSGYMVKNSAGKVRLFRGPEDPTDPLSDSIDIDFTYNSTGYLTRADYSFTGIPVTVLRSIYTYTGANLTKARTELLFPSAETAITADLTYSAQAVKNFIYTFPDAYTIAPYLPAFDFGNRPANALQRVKTVYFDAGVATDSAITNYKNYKLSNDGYVLEFFAEGDYQDGMGIYDGRTKFKYFCR